MRPRAALPFLLLLALFAVLAYFASRSDGGDSIEEQGNALLTYEEAFEPIGVDAGRAVVEGLRHELTQLSQGKRGPERREEITAWGDVLGNVRDSLAALDPPEFLEEPHQMRLDALDRYIDIAGKLAATVDARGDDREQRLDAIPSIGDEADKLWDDAEEMVNDHRRRLGLPVVTLPFDD